MGRVNIFLQPFVVVKTVVFVTTVDETVFVTWVVSRDVVLVNSKTLLGARSKGLKIVFTPLSASTSIISPSLSFLASLLASEPLLLLDARLDTEDTFVEATDDISDAMSAARTSGLKEFHASRIEAGSSGLGNLNASSLYYRVGWGGGGLETIVPPKLRDMTVVVSWS